MTHPHRPSLISAITLALLAPAALAQDAAVQDTAPDASTAEITDAPTPWSISLSAGTEYVTGSFSDISGDLNIFRVNTDVTIARRIGQRRRLSLSLSQERSFYDFDGALGIVPADPADADPLSEGQTLSIRPTFAGQEASGLNWFVTGSLTWAGEPSALFDDALTFGIGAAASWKNNDSLRLGAGLFARTRIEDDATVIPFPIVEWTINDDWSLTLGTQGAGAALIYQARKDVLSFALEVGFESREYRLGDTNAFADGVLQDRAVPVALAAVWTPNDRVTLTGRIGAHAWGEVEFLDASGNRVNREDRDVAFLIGLDLRVAF